MANVSQMKDRMLSQDGKIKRNIVIYVGGVLTMSSIGGLVTATGEEIGGLLLVSSPVLMAILLRTFGRDGWIDAGFRLNLSVHWRWYLFSLLLYPAAFFLMVVLGASMGVITVNKDWNTLAPILLSGIGGQIIIRVLFATFEECGWRGYLEPRLLALGVPDIQRHILVGFIWAAWHVPLILSTNYTNVPYAIFLPLFLIGVITLSIVYGQLRKLSGTVWTSVLLHGIGNAIAWPMIQSDSITFNNKWLAYVGPESVMSIVLFGLIAFWMMNRQRTNWF